MVEFTRSSSTHSYTSTDSGSFSDRSIKGRSRLKSNDVGEKYDLKNSGLSPPSRDLNHQSSGIKHKSVSVIEFDPTYVSVDFYCNYCNQSLPPSSCRIRCAECPDYDLCISCSCSLKCTEPHDLGHNYAPIGPNTFELFSEGWSADEELMLLEGIGKYGFGNWKQVAEMVNKVNSKIKSPAECESHYYDVYITSGPSPHPNVKNLRTPIKCLKSRETVYQYYDEVVKNHRRFEHPESEDIVSSEETGSHSTFIPPPVNLLHTEPSKVKFFQNFTGYNIYRDELDNEYHPDVEMMLKDVEFEPWDSPAETQFKVQLIDLYNDFLDERIYRRRILMHRFWNDYLIRENAMQNMTELEKMLYWRLSPLLRFHSEEDHIKLTKLLIAKIELEKRLEIVQQWSSLGLKTLRDIKEFDALKLPSKYSSSKHNTHFSKISNLSNKIVSQGVVHMDELNEYMNEVNEKFCNEFYITKSHLEDILASVNAAVPDSDFDPEKLFTHLYDVHFEDFTVEQNTFYPNITKLPNISDFPENSNLRVILDPESTEFDLSDIKPDKFTFGHIKHNSQQSNVVPHNNSSVYLTNFYHDRDNKVQKNLQKPKIEVQYPNKRRLSNRRLL